MTTTTPTKAADTFKPLVKDPKLVWHQPAGLTGADLQVVNELHTFYLHYMKFAHTANLKDPQFLRSGTLGPNVVLTLVQELSPVTSPETGTLTVTVTSVASTGGIEVVNDCYDQSSLFVRGKNGKPVIYHGPSSHIQESWGFSQKASQWVAENLNQISPCA